MSRFGQYGGHDEGERPEGDGMFVGVNCKLEPGRLKPGVLADAQNTRLRRQVIEPRLGIVTPAEFNAAGLRAIYGRGVYSDPNTDAEWVLLAGPDRVWMMRDGCAPRWIGLPPGESITGVCELVQCFNVVVLFRGATLQPLVWQGSLMAASEVPNQSVTVTGNTGSVGTFAGYATVFGYIDQTADGTGTSGIPNADTGVVFANRLLVPFGRDQVAVSDVLDYTRYSTTLAQFRINSGTNERLVAVLPYSAAATVLMFKSRSVWALANVSGDLSGAQLSAISNAVGCCARRSVAMVGGDVLFLCDAPAGVFQVQAVVLQGLQAAPVPVSDAVEPWINRINWACASGAAAAVYGEYYFLAVPMDGATSNNAVLVFNTVTGQWEGRDVFPAGVEITDLFVTLVNGQRRLFAADYAAGRVYLMYEGPGDRIGTAECAVAMQATTRAYALESAVTRKRMERLCVTGAGWNPVVSLEVSLEGVGESIALVENEGADRTAWTVVGRAGAYSATDGTMPHRSARRADYSVVCPFLCKSDLALNVRQAFLRRQPVRALGLTGQVTVSSSQGQVEVRRILLEGVETERGRV